VHTESSYSISDQDKRLGVVRKYFGRAGLDIGLYQKGRKGATAVSHPARLQWWVRLLQFQDHLLLSVHPSSPKEHQPPLSLLSFSAPTRHPSHHQHNNNSTNLLACAGIVGPLSSCRHFALPLLLSHPTLCDQPGLTHVPRNCASHPVVLSIWSDLEPSP
jgi:hypothetical protein